MKTLLFVLALSVSLRADTTPKPVVVPEVLALRAENLVLKSQLAEANANVAALKGQIQHLYAKENTSLNHQFVTMEKQMCAEAKVSCDDFEYDVDSKQLKPKKKSPIPPAGTR